MPEMRFPSWVNSWHKQKHLQDGSTYQKVPLLAWAAIFQLPLFSAFKPFPKQIRGNDATKLQVMEASLKVKISTIILAEMNNLTMHQIIEFGD